MKKLLFITALALSGCCSTTVCSEGGRTMCVVSTYGWRLWDLLPIASGSIDKHNEPETVWFEDTVTLETNLKALDLAAKRHGASGTKSLDSFMTDEQTLFTFYRRTYYTSCELTFDDNEGEAK